MKEQIIERADELAMEIYDKEFYNLTSSEQDKIFKKAERDVVDNYADHADSLRKAKKELFE